jgi:hypothetical protein
LGWEGKENNLGGRGRSGQQIGPLRLRQHLQVLVLVVQLRNDLGQLRKLLRRMRVGRVDLRHDNQKSRYE